VGKGGGRGGASAPTLGAQKGEVGTTGLRADECENNEGENNSSFRWGPLVRQPPQAHAGQRAHAGQTSGSGSSKSLCMQLLLKSQYRTCNSKVSLDGSELI
jgi:hypothetical protein